MRINRLTLFVLVLMCSVTLRASAQEYDFGSTLSQGVAGVVTLLPSSPSVIAFHPSLTAFSDQPTAAELSYRQLYGLTELEDLAIQGRHRFQKVSVGIAINRFGKPGLYQEYAVTAGSSFLLKPQLSVGAALEYRSAEFGDGQARYAGANLALSASYRPMPSTIASIAIRRLSLDPVYEDYDSDPVYEASVAWRSLSEVALGAIWTREYDGEHRFALGQVLKLGRSIEFLSGLRFDPVRYSLGGRVFYQGMSLVYSYNGHPDLGSTHSFALGWSR
jgi:hypothetical protein